MLHNFEENEISSLDIELERDVFLRNLVRELSGVLEEIIGLDEASGFISIVGKNIGHQINKQYRKELHVEKLNKEQISLVLQDLKRRIKGGFYIVEIDENKVVFGNRCCPFGDKVLQRKSLCMMTSNVFGTIVAENIGYAKVDIQKSIASGDPECHVVVYFSPESGGEGEEYFD